MISISLCMIVKNEERVLARCLDSLCELMDEIIIVDTGSTDKTKEIASKYTDKVYDFTWVDDFSAARNFSFSKATMEYIYVADADEVLNEENQRAFAQMKQKLLPEIEIVQMYYCNQKQFNTTYNYDKEYRPKLYKRLRQFVWQDAIHENVRLEPIIYDSEICIDHMPEENHASRDFSNFQRMLERGERLSTKLHNMYARELMIAGENEDFQKAEAFFLQSVKDTSRTLDEIKEASVVLAHGYRLKQEIALFFQYVMKDIVTEPSSEACYELGEFYFERGDYEEASNWYLNARVGAAPILDIRTQQEYPTGKLKECYEILKERAMADGNDLAAASYEEAIEQLMQ